MLESNEKMNPLKHYLRYLLPRGIHRHRVLFGHFRGRHIVTSWYDYPAAILGYTERPLISWFTDNVGINETWLDIGAHYGYTAIALSELVGKHGRVFAFEPMISTAGYVTQTRFANGFTHLIVVPYALSDVNDLILDQLPTVRGMVDSTIQNNNWHETILVASLDWLWPRICGDSRQIDGIKIDVQGMEMEVIRGMQEVLHTYKPKLVLEFHTGVDREEILELLEGCGYSRFAIPIEPLNGEKEPAFLDDRSYAFWPIS